MKTRVLIIEDDASIAELEKRHLERAGFNAYIAFTGNEGLDLIRSGEGFDLLIIDYNLPDMSGVDLMQSLKEMGKDIPSVIVTAAGNENVAVSAMKLGAMDYIVKDRETIKQLPDTCRDVLGRFDLASENERLMVELKKVNAELTETNVRLEDISRRDDLTGIFNRRYLMEMLHVEFARAIRYHSPLSLAIFDLDHFKSVNDTFGHTTGDRVLIQFVDTIRDRLRKTDTFGRYGGEEFAIIITETPLEQAMILCEELRDVISRIPFGHGHSPIRLTTSAGVATIAREMDDKDDLINLADKSLYSAKEEGRDRVVALQHMKNPGA
jgi:two-component system cell cycle response regulator